MKSVKNLLLTGLIALAAVTIGCPTGDDDSSSPPTEFQFPPIDEPTTGQAQVTGSNISLTDYTGGDIPSTSSAYEGSTFWVTGGKLSFTLDTPTSFYQPGVDPDFFGRTSAGYEVTVSDSSTQAALFEGFSSPNNGTTIARYKFDTDGKTYQLECKIAYIYVDRNCTFSREAKEWIKTDNPSYTEKYAAFNLELKTGWNLVQTDTYAIRTEGTTTLRIATKDVPWSIVPQQNN
jgi:hypothetical protein